MIPLKDKIERMLSNPAAHAQNSGSLEDQFEFILSILDSDWVIQYQNWKLSKSISYNTKMSSVYPNITELAEVLYDFYYVYLGLDD